MSTIPPDIIASVCAHIYSFGLPAPYPSLDPLVISDSPLPAGLPSTYPPGNWPEPLSRRTLANLCLVNHAWCAAAKPWLWRRLHIRLPRSWLAIVDQLAWDANHDDGDSAEQTAIALEQSIKAAAGAALASNAVNRGVPHIQKEKAALEMEERILERLYELDSPIPLELLSPPPSRDPSPRRLRTKSKSPARWRIMRTISDAVRSVVQRQEPGVYVPCLPDPRPGRYIRHLDFNHFRTIGMRRSVDEGVNSRFVTGARLEAILKEMINLTAFGATEYMDGALTILVLRELFLRGPLSRRGRDRTSRGRGLTTIANADISDSDEEDSERRRDCKELEALDLTGCVSAVFVNALTEFVSSHLISANDTSEQPRRSREDAPTTLSFPGLTRLGLRGVKSVAALILMPFVLAFPSLTHLDLSCTRATPALLAALGSSHTVRLRSLSLGRCVLLTGASVRDLLVESPTTRGLTELALYADLTYGSPLAVDDLRAIMARAACFASGTLVYLDLSGAPLTSELLLDVCPPQGALRSLGMSYVREGGGLEVGVVREFLRRKAPGVEVLTLAGTCPELEVGAARAAVVSGGGARGRASAREASIALHAQFITPLCAPQQHRLMAPPTPAPTRLRVIELSTALLACLGGGAGSWRIVRSKGGRGWYVDGASAWVGGVFSRDVPLAEGGEEWRRTVERLADANGNVGSGIGWHARKMEVLHGHGLLGREDGLYGAVSFAYQG